MDEILTALLANAAFRSLVEGIAVKVFVNIFYRCAVDPEFEKKCDVVFDQYSKAQTDQDKENALSQIQNLISTTPSAR